jgi:hypothetical protein
MVCKCYLWIPYSITTVVGDGFKLSVFSWSFTRFFVEFFYLILGDSDVLQFLRDIAKRLPLALKILASL